MRFCFRSSDEGDKRSSEIDHSIREENRKGKVLSLLLLGAGESGKSTILKQFKILHNNGFSTEEIEAHREFIKNNVMHAMILILRATLADPSLSIDSALQPDAMQIAAFSEYRTPLTLELAHKITRLWQDPAVQYTFENKPSLQVQSNARMIIESAVAIASPNYVPSESDILHSRVRTTGIMELRFGIDRTQFRIVDIGGQRCERKKWIHCFDGISALLYVVALDEYDLTLFEDEKTNRMLEALHLFEDMCNHSVFANTSTILFLNKKDLFREKLKHVNLSSYFPEYTGGADYKMGCDFIRMKYLSLNKTEKIVYTHFTCATSTKNIRKVFEDVRHSILVGHINRLGIL